MRTIFATALLLLAVGNTSYAQGTLLDPLNLLGFMQQLFEPRETYQPASRYEPQQEEDQQDPELARQVVDYPSLPAGTVVISAAQRRLYFGLGQSKALRYAIGVGKQGMGWKGVVHIGAKKEWPTWTPPAEMLQRRPDLPRFMSGGINNPLGARALYLFEGARDTLYRIHGTNEPDTIGQAVSSGCFRMMNNDVIDLYNRVQAGSSGTTVRVM